MVEAISSWAQGIVIAIIIAVMIEMILPEGSNKKYIKMVIGIFILFTIVSPIITKIAGQELNLNSVLDYQKYVDSDATQTMAGNLEKTTDQNIETIYKTKLENDIKSKIKEKGYQVNKIQVEIEQMEENYGRINKLILDVSKKEEESVEETNNQVQTIEKVNITISNDTVQNKTEEKEYKMTESESKELKKYLANIYDMKEKEIEIY